jgi:hypothetical protein
MTVEERTVLLYDTPCIITISHPSKTVWIAVGDYKGERIEVKGPSANTDRSRIGMTRIKNGRLSSSRATT